MGIFQQFKVPEVCPQSNQPFSSSMQIAVIKLPFWFGAIHSINGDVRVQRKEVVVDVAVVAVVWALGEAAAIPDSASFLINDIFKLCFEDSVRDDDGANIGRRRRETEISGWDQKKETTTFNHLHH